ncbi:MAG: hypothetical protein GTN81_00090 [Proteobacteria bacterium]|nr:hypothetical protein [Pseudomonadota bacterium]
MGKIKNAVRYQKLRCRSHPSRRATYRCDNCGRFYCKQCVKGQGFDRVFCAECELAVADFLDLI